MKLVPLPDEKRPLLFAHRGLSSIAPENTMAAFELARSRGIPGIELDVHLASTGELVVIHDDTTRRVGWKDMKVEESTWSELRKIDIGSWKGEQYRNERIPLLTDLFDALSDSVYYDIEIKCATAKETGIEKKLADILSSVPAGKRCVVSSFNPVCLSRFKLAAPSVPTGIIYCASRDLPWFLRRGEGRWIGKTDFVKPEYVKVRRGYMSLMSKAEKRRVIPWTVDSPYEAERLVKEGCDGIISNTPHMLGLL